VLCTVRLEMPAPRQATPTKKKPLSAVAAQALKRPADPARTFVAVRSCVADELVRTVFTTLTGHGHLHFTRRGAPAAAAPSGRSASNVHNSPTQSTPGLSAQFLRTRHRRLRRGSSSYAAGFSGIR
jgi:hypothetical protein